MKISKTIEALNKILQEKGDLEVYLDVTEEIDCNECGGSKSTIYDGFLESVSTINLNHKIAAWLYAKHDS